MNGSQVSPQGTPTIRRGAIVQWQRTSAHETILANLQFTLFCESAALIYLSLCLLLIPSGSSQPASCDMSAKQNLGTFLFWVLWPIVSIRFIGYFSYRNTDYNTLKNLTLLLSVQYNLSYGIWTCLNISKIIAIQTNSPVRCQLSTNMTDLNYAVVVIFGMFPALTMASVVIIALCFSPCIVYYYLKNRNE